LLACDSRLQLAAKRSEREEVTELMATLQIKNNLSKLPKKEQGDHLRAMFARIDLDGDGALSRAELVTRLRQVRNPHLILTSSSPHPHGPHLILTSSSPHLVTG